MAVRAPPAVAALLRLGSPIFELVRAHPWHWLRVCAIVMIAMYTSHLIENTDPVLSLRYKLFQTLQELMPHQSQGVTTVVLLIDDETYWRGEPDGRVPLNRRFLAKLLKDVAKYQPAVIAVDFDLRAPDPTGQSLRTLNHPGETLEANDASRQETHDLLATISDLSRAIPIALPRTVNINAQGHYVTEADVHDGFDFGAESDVHFGYIALPKDMRVIPAPLHLDSNQTLDSFSVAIARARFPELCDQIDFSRTMYATFSKDKHLATISSSQLQKSMSDLKLRRKLEAAIRNNVVVIGGGWHTRAEGRGELVDVHMTPTGRQHGAVIHSQYAESLMHGRTFFPAKSLTLRSIELLLTFIIALILKSKVSHFKKLIYISLCCLFPTFISYFGIVNFGVYFDLTIVTILLLAHTFLEHILEWRADSRELEAIRSKGLST